MEKAHWPTQIQAAVRQCAAATWSVSPPWPPHGLSSNSRPDKASTVLRILQANGQATCVEVSRDRARYFTCPGRRNCFCRRSSPLVPHSVQHPTNSPSRVVSRADAARPETEKRAAPVCRLAVPRTLRTHVTHKQTKQRQMRKYRHRHQPAKESWIPTQSHPDSYKGEEERVRKPSGCGVGVYVGGGDVRERGVRRCVCVGLGRGGAG